MKEINHLGLTLTQLKEMGLRIKKLREGMNLSQKDLAVICEFPSASRIGGYEIGDRCPTLRALEIIAKSLKTTVDYLKDGRAPLYSSSSMVKMEGVQMLPILTPHEAYYWRFRMEDYKKDSERKFVAVPANINPKSYIYKVDNDENTAPAGVSMTLIEGELITIDPEGKPVTDSIVAFTIKNSVKVHLRRLVEVTGKQFLKPLNSHYPMLELNDEITIVGLAVGKFIPFI